MEEFLKYADNPAVFILGIVLWWLGKFSEKFVLKWVDMRSVSKGGALEATYLLQQLIIKTLYEYNADKAFIMGHNDKEGYTSVLLEYSPKIPHIEKDYQKVPHGGKARWAIGKLRTDKKIFCNTLKEVEHTEHRNHMAYLGLNSWYCFALKKGDILLGSLNLYFIKEKGIDPVQIDSLSGRISYMGNLLSKIKV
jgi:hypothetical protein